MKSNRLLEQRLSSQQLSRHDHTDIQGLVRHMGAVQAQDYAMARWALGLRLAGSTDARIEEALSTGTLLRTHVLRPTWHLVHPGDIRWMLQLSAPRILRQTGTYFRKLELDHKVLGKCMVLLEKNLRDQGHLARAAIAGLLEHEGISTKDLRLNHILLYAELAGLICSGKPEGRQQTYALLEARVPPAPALSREEQLGTLALRYFGSHGPAGEKDFAWWAGLTLTDARAAIGLAGSALQQERTGESISWYIPCDRVKKKEMYLLPNFDEYTVAYQDRTLLLPANAEGLYRDGQVIFNNVILAGGTVAGTFNNVILAGGTVAGTWTRTMTAREVRVETRLFAPLTAPGQKQLDQAVDRYRRFLGLAKD